MRDDDILIGSLMEDSWLTLEQLAAACAVEPDWLRAISRRACSCRGHAHRGRVWRFSCPPASRPRGACATRARFRRRARTRRAGGGLLEEMDALRARLRREGSEP